MPGIEDFLKELFAKITKSNLTADIVEYVFNKALPVQTRSK